eukprot:INCI5928.9.p1 GENE.INCI5928.9~~INCI5928.9.p1  ORF type:complete len:425 (+),score=62.69 INCI5928.9:1048-2322(+)
MCSAGLVGPQPTFQAEINVSQACWDTARVGGYGQLSFPDRVENVGVFTMPGQWWLDRVNTQVVISTPINATATPLDAVASVKESLLTLSGIHDVQWANVSFEHTTWLQPNREQGFVERYGNVYFGNANKTLLVDPAGSVTVGGSRDVHFLNCSFQRLGAWAVALNNATQSSSVQKCTFFDLGGGAVMVGNVDKTNNITDPNSQMANIIVEDNSIVRVGVTFHGAPSFHSFCMRDSSFSHNTIRDVSYSGISFNWPNPQGPTTGAGGDDLTMGYSANNIVAYNDVSLFMRNMNDGGGIHTIGRSRNTSIHGNYFHQLAAGSPGEISEFAQSIIYIDNWSCDLNITDNVVDDCPGTKQGFYFFQGHTGNNGLAHDNEIQRLAVRNGGHLSGISVACNCSEVDVLAAGSPLPDWATDVVNSAGRRSS